MALRARLTVWYGTALALILIVFATVLYAVLARGLKDQVDQSLQQAALAAVHALENRFGPFLPFEDFSAQFPELAVVDKFFQIFSPTGNITIRIALLEYLMRNAGRVLTRPMIVEHVWNMDFDSFTNVIDVYVNYLRNKIDRGRERKLIQTVRGSGYVLRAE